MADTIRDRATLQGLLADNVSGDISPQDVRDFLVSAYGWVNKTIGGDIYYTEGLVGIGIDTPTEPLHVEGDALFDQGYIYLGPYLAANDYTILKQQAGPTKIAFQSSAAANTLILDMANLRLGIGGIEPTVILDLNGDSLRIRNPQSPASGGAGIQGEIAWDASYIYVCTATNTWERAALTGGY